MAERSRTRADRAVHRAGTGWYHELITREAAREATTWSVPPENLTGENAHLIGPTAADALAWHADYLDSYLYSPLWWFGPTSGGGWDRFVVAMMQRDDLAALHFDDLTSSAQVRSVWRRILGGTVAGLFWAAERRRRRGSPRDRLRAALHPGLLLPLQLGRRRGPAQPHVVRGRPRAGGQDAAGCTGHPRPTLGAPLGPGAVAALVPQLGTALAASPAARAFVFGGVGALPFPDELNK